MSGVRTEKLQLSLPGNPQQVPKLPAPRLLFLVRKQQSRITQFPVTMGSTPPPPLILRRPLPAVLRRSPDGSTSTASRPMGDGKRQKTASAREDPCCPCSISSTCYERNCRAPRHGGPAEIATQAAGNAPTRLPPTTQSSARPIATISLVPHRGDFVSAWAYRRAR